MTIQDHSADNRNLGLRRLWLIPAALVGAVAFPLFTLGSLLGLLAIKFRDMANGKKMSGFL